MADPLDPATLRLRQQHPHAPTHVWAPALDRSLCAMPAGTQRVDPDLDDAPDLTGEVTEADCLHCRVVVRRLLLQGERLCDRCRGRGRICRLHGATLCGACKTRGTVQGG